MAVLNTVRNGRRTLVKMSSKIIQTSNARKPPIMIEYTVYYLLHMKGSHTHAVSFRNYLEILFVFLNLGIIIIFFRI